MLKAYFKANGEDYRPVIWPVKHPYWCTGYTVNNDFEIDKATMIAYVDSIEDLMTQWPEAEDIETEEVEKPEFSSRFSKPDWYEASK